VEELRAADLGQGKELVAGLRKRSPAPLGISSAAGHFGV
jgi:hypothetical protein